MAEFIYSNVKNANIGYMLFELNYDYHPQMFDKKNIDFDFSFKIADKLSTKLKKLIIVYFKKISTISMIFKNKLTIKTLSFKVTPLIIKFD